METDLTPYQAATHIAATSVLVLAPHADDEVFGCGGAILDYVSIQTPVSVVVLTDGGRYGDPMERMGESRAAAAMLGYGEPEFWSLGDRTLYQDQSLVERFVKKILVISADLVFAPSPWEIHPDHRRTASAAAEAVRRTGIRIAFYEVGNPLPPNLLLDITLYAEAKKKAMLCFTSQLMQQNYDRQIFALNQYRTYTLSREVVAAEAYLLFTADELASNLPDMLMDRPVSLGASASWQATAERFPLVSVLILSMNSAHLHETIDSIALQTYQNIEVIVVSSDSQHKLVPEYCGPFKLRFFSTDVPLCRSQIANKALRAVRGEFFLFIDGDDWLSPKHIAQLMGVLEQQSCSLAVYSNIALAGPEAEPLGQIIDFLSDGAQKLYSDMTFIHSVLFSQKLLALGCQFDEKLDSYEDWDFFLQASLQTQFINFPFISATHRVRNRFDAKACNVYSHPEIEIIYDKWAALWRLGKAKQFMPVEWFYGNLKEKLLEKEKFVAQAENAIKNQNLIIDRQACEINDFFNSHSWRLTVPLRWLSSMVKRCLR